MLYLLVLSVLCASVNSVLLHKVQLKSSVAVYRFNLLCSAVWCVALFALNGFQLHLSKTVLLWGCIYGVTQTLFILFKTLAMNSGSVSITTLVGNMSLLVSVLFCYFVWAEPIGLADIFGLLLLIAGIIFSTYEKSAEKSAKKWPVYLCFFLFFAASVGISFKGFSKAGQPQSAGDMMFTASLIMLLCYAVLSFWPRKDSKKSESSKVFSKEFVIYALISGLFSCAYNRLNIYLSGAMNAVVFFPAFNGGVILLSTVLSILILRERLRFKTALGILLGVIGICIIGIL